MISSLSETEVAELPEANNVICLALAFNVILACCLPLRFIQIPRKLPSSPGPLIVIVAVSFPFSASMRNEELSTWKVLIPDEAVNT